MWKAYLKERENLETFENETGFLTFEISNGLCFLSDIYVRPEFRGTRAAYKLYKAVWEIAVSEGCTILRGMVDESTPGAAESFELMKRLGFEPFTKDGNVTYLQLKLYTVRGT